MTDGVVLAHDYATQRGGAERVALLMVRAFAGSPLYTTLFDPAGTFPEFADVDLRTSGLDRVALLRHRHRLALPLLAGAVDRHRVEGDVLLASSTGWAHGYRGARRTVVYCHAPARWLYQRDRYLGHGGGLAARARTGLARTVLRALDRPLRDWDRRAAERADTYLVNSSVTRDAVRTAYGIEAEVLPPPAALGPGVVRALPGQDGEGLAPGYLLCVARLLPYKNVDVVVQAAIELGCRLVVVGDGPDRARLEQLAARGPAGAVRFVGRVDDAELRWLYQHAAATVAASYEDYGLTPLEAGAFQVPVVALRAGGYLDTVAPGVNGEFFDDVTPDAVATAVERVLATVWDQAAMRSHLARFGEERFTERIRSVVTGQLETLRGSDTARDSSKGAVA